MRHKVIELYFCIDGNPVFVMQQRGLSSLGVLDGTVNTNSQEYKVQPQSHSLEPVFLDVTNKKSFVYSLWTTEDFNAIF